MPDDLEMKFLTGDVEIPTKSLTFEEAQQLVDEGKAAVLRDPGGLIDMARFNTKSLIDSSAELERHPVVLPPDPPAQPDPTKRPDTEFDKYPAEGRVVWKLNEPDLSNKEENLLITLTVKLPFFGRQRQVVPEITDTLKWMAAHGYKAVGDILVSVEANPEPVL